MKIEYTWDAEFRPAKQDFPNDHPNPCSIHGKQPEIRKEQKKKGARRVDTGWVSVICTTCQKEDSSRFAYGYDKDAINNWNRLNPLISGDKESLHIERQILIQELKYIKETISELQKDYHRIEMKISSEKERIQVKLDRIQQISEHIDA